MDFVKMIQFATDLGFDLIEISKTQNGAVKIRFQRRAPGGNRWRHRCFSPVRFDTIEAHAFQVFSNVAGWELRFTDEGYRVYKCDTSSPTWERPLTRQIVNTLGAMPPPEAERPDTIPPTERSPTHPSQPRPALVPYTRPGPQIGCKRPSSVPPSP